MAAALPANFEGCGKIGKIRSIFFAEFHPIAGPMIRCQAPANGRDLITKDIFETISSVIIPKPQLDRTPLTINANDRKICGYPVILKNEKYKRNQFMFNVCFVCHSWSRTVQYEPALIKLSNFLVDLELENGFLCNEQNTDQLQALLEQVLADLNDRGECSAVVCNYSLMLKVINNKPDPPPVNDWDVPVLLIDINQGEGLDAWDLTSQQILPHINGQHHVAKVAAFAGVEANLVRVCVQNLLYHEVVHIVPIFQFSNVYVLNPKHRELCTDLNLRAKFMAAIKRDPEDERPRSFRDVYRMVSEFEHHSTVLDIVQAFRPKENMNIEIIRFITFLVRHKILRKIHKYPVYSVNKNGSLENENVGGVQGAAAEYYPYFTGQKHFDEICCTLRMSSATLENIIETDPNVYVLRK